MKTIPVRHIADTQKELVNTGRFSIRKIETILNGSDLQHDLHRHDFYFVLLIQSGSGIHEIDFTAHPVTDQTVFVLRPGQVHQLQLKADTKGFLLEFDTEFYHPSDKLSQQRLRKAGNKNFCKFESHQFRKLNFYIANIFEECLDKKEGYRDAVRAGLELFFIEYVRQSDNPESNLLTNSGYAIERLEEFTELMEKNVANQKQIAFYTGKMNLSAYQLNEITKKTIGKTASTLIDEYILLQAKRYLLATSNQVKDIAWDLGYEDPSYFIRFFKKQTGTTPEIFRQNFK